MFRIVRSTVVLIAVLALMACGAFTDQVLQPGWRQVVFTVQNDSPRPAHLFVARDGQPMGAVVGTANPATIAPNTTMDVTFGLPPEGGWWIFVNPGPQNGPLIGENDVPPRFSGRSPVTLAVGAEGGVGASVSGSPSGWMGNP